MTEVDPQFVKQIIEERNRHFDHAQNVKLQTFLTVGAGIAGLTASLDTLANFSVGINVVLGLILSIGMGGLVWAVWIHTKLHQDQIDGLEDVLDRYVAKKCEKQLTHLFTDDNCGRTNPRPLRKIFDSEPEPACSCQNHDQLFVIALFCMWVGIWTAIIWKSCSPPA